eukprot:7795492-Prorocentrum_lima.AAC.1
MGHPGLAVGAAGPRTARAAPKPPAQPPPGAPAPPLHRRVRDHCRAWPGLASPQTRPRQAARLGR